MIVETAMINELRTLLAMERVYYGTAPQQHNDQPIKYPLVIVNRVGTRWTNTFCGVDDSLELATIQVDFYGNTTAEARTLADKARKHFNHWNLDSEISLYDDISRGWRVIQQWLISDYAPSLV